MDGFSRGKNGATHRSCPTSEVSRVLAHSIFFSFPRDTYGLSPCSGFLFYLTQKEDCEVPLSPARIALSDLLPGPTASEAV